MNMYSYQEWRRDLALWSPATST